MCKLLVFVLCFWFVFCVSGKNVFNPANSDGCHKINDFFSLRNITVNTGPYDKDTICGGKCCTADGEALLRAAGRKDLEFQLRLHARSLRTRLGHTAINTRDHVTELTRESENATLYLFSQVYRKMAVLAKEPITLLYSDLRNYINITSEHAGPSSLNIENSIMDFFTKLFPLVYHHAVNLKQKDFSQEYKTCLRQSIGEIQPFGEIPSQISKSVLKSLEATRILLQAFWLGSDVLNATDILLFQEAKKADSCHSALLKMSYCPKCLGLDVKVKPCAGYCLNVLRGCLTQHVSELDHPWNGYVNALERLVNAVKNQDTGTGVNVDSVIKGLDSRITEAIMYAMENGASLEKKVNRACGHAKLSDVEFPNDDDIANLQNPRQQRPRPQRPVRGGSGLRSSPIDTEIINFLTLVTGSKGFFLNLADTLCRDENFAEQMDGAECWNGERIGEYTKTVVGSSASFQRYNPEVDIPAIVAGEESPISESRVAKLSDQLRHMTQTVLTQLSSSLQSESYMQGDEAESVEGSGSGRSGDRFSDDEEGGRDVSTWSDHEGDYDGSGSGNGDLENDDKVRIHKTDNSGKTENSPAAGGATSHVAGSSTWMLLFILFILQYSVVSKQQRFLL